MKNSYLICIYLGLFMACETPEVTSEPTATNDTATYYNRAGDLPPFNSASDYDSAGEVHSEIFQTYYTAASTPTSLDSIIDLVNLKMSEHPYYRALPDFDYHTFSIAEVQGILSNPTHSLSKALDESPLSAYAKTHFQTFLSDLTQHIHNEEDYTLIYDFIVSYESALDKDVQHSQAEKEFLLTVTSIARHSIYHKDKKPKKNTDPDWNWLTTCITGAINGAVFRVPESISLALKTGIGAE